MAECPGSERFRKPTPEFFNCPFCDTEVEIWTDEVKAKCPGCGQVVSQDRLQGCIDYCEQARACLGELRYQRLVPKERRKPLT